MKDTNYAKLKLTVRWYQKVTKYDNLAHLKEATIIQNSSQYIEFLSLTTLFTWLKRIIK